MKLTPLLVFLTLLVLVIHTRNLQSSIISGDISLPPYSFDIDDLYTINYEFEPPGFITMAITFKKPNQFFAIGYGTGMVGADIWTFELINNQVVATDRFALEHSPPPADTDIGGTNNLELLGYEINSAFTLVKVRRALDTGDPNDAVIPEGPVSGVWATAPSPTMEYHGETKGVVVFPFQLPVAPSVETPETVLPTENLVLPVKTTTVPVVVEETKNGRVKRRKWVCRRWCSWILTDILLYVLVFKAIYI